MTEVFLNTVRAYVIISLKQNKATQSPEISRQQVQKLTPQFVCFIYTGYRFPLSLCTIIFVKKNFVFYSQNLFFLERLDIAKQKKIVIWIG